MEFAVNIRKTFKCHLKSDINFTQNMCVKNDINDFLSSFFVNGGLKQIAFQSDTIYLLISV